MVPLSVEAQCLTYVLPNQLLCTRNTVQSFLRRVILKKPFNLKLLEN